MDSDAENVFITIVARSLRPDVLIVARAAREQPADRLYRAGATHVVVPACDQLERAYAQGTALSLKKALDLALGKAGPA